MSRARLVSGDSTPAVSREKRLRQCEGSSPGRESEERPGIASGLLLFPESLLEEGGLLKAPIVSMSRVFEKEDRIGGLPFVEDSFEKQSQELAGRRCLEANPEAKQPVRKNTSPQGAV